MKLLVMFLLTGFCAIAQVKDVELSDFKSVDQKVLTYSRFGEKLYCVPSRQVSDNFLLGKREMAIASLNSPQFRGSIECYQCCVGEAPLTSETCKKHGLTNWARGKNCGCNSH